MRGQRGAIGPAGLLAALVAVAAALAATRLSLVMPPLRWWSAALHPDLDTPRDLVFAFSVLPRLAAAALCGASLGLAGALLQQALGNPLASPTTLGIESGTQLALTVAVIFAPSLLAGGREAVALAGGAATLAVVFLCARARGLSALSVVLAGFVVALFCSALSACLKLLNEEYATVLFLWGGGSLEQGDWSVPLVLASRIGAVSVLAALAVKPLSILSLSDESARALGAPVGLVRLAALALAVALTASVGAAVGTIGFVGLAAPQIARLAGARRFGVRLPAAALVGAALLVAVDACVAMWTERPDAVRIPTGAATAVLGAPLLVWLLPRIRLAAAPVAELGFRHRPGRRPGTILAVLAALLAVALLGALAVGRDASGLTLAGPAELARLAEWRVPRALVAGTAGAMLATTGLVLQRLTGNPLASPEVLGIGTGVALGVTAGILLLPELGPLELVLAGTAGAALAVVVLLVVGARSRFAPEHLLLAGLALTSLLDVLVLTFFAAGDLRSGQLLGFISGSTYRSGWPEAALGVVAAAILIPAALAARRVLDALPLGEPVAKQLGLSLPATRFALTGLVSGLTAASVLLAGPLSFVGLIGPHLARLLGLRRALGETAGAALVGALVMVAADWVARVAIYPRQLPAGLVAALIGLPYLVWQLGRGEGRRG